MTGVEQTVTDPYLWLEEVTDERALDFARAHNEVVVERFASSGRFTELERRILDMLDTDTKIAYPGRRGRWLYNFWRDAEHPRGLWRRTTFAEYAKEAPEWDVLIDLDALGTTEGENWVWGGAAVLRPEQSRALISLSRGGADAKVVREFDIETREFIEPTDGGYFLPEAKSEIRWIDIDSVYAGTDFGPGALTDSGYPRIAKRWRRGTPSPRPKRYSRARRAMSRSRPGTTGHPAMNGISSVVPPTSSTKRCTCSKATAVCGISMYRPTPASPGTRIGSWSD